MDSLDAAGEERVALLAMLLQVSSQKGFPVQAGSKASTAKRPPEVADLVAHVRGTQRMGLVPHVTDTEVGFAAIDLDLKNDKIDPYGDEAKAILSNLSKALRDKGIPFGLEQSKGKGWHFWILFTSPVSAAAVRGVLKGILRDCKIQCKADTITPRSDKLKAGSGTPGYGNGVYLPFFGGDEGSRTKLCDPGTFEPYADGNAALKAFLAQPCSTEVLLDLASAIPASAPSKPIESLNPSNGPGAPFKLPKEIPEGARNDLLFRYGCSLRARGAGEEEILGHLQKENAARCKPPLDGAEIASIAQSAARYSPGAAISSSDPSVRPECTDLANARRLVALYGDRFRYLPAERAVLIWRGTHWGRDETGEIERLAKDTVRSIRDEAEATSHSGDREQLARHARQSQTSGRIKAMIELARTEPEIAISAEQVDSDRDLLNCANGTLDLRSFELRPHRPEDLLTRVAPASFDPAAESALWTKFVKRAVPHEETRRYLQKLLGYILSGRPDAHLLSFILGVPRAGKGTFVDALASTLGPYAATAGLRDFEVPPRSGARPQPELLRLRAVRMVAVHETGGSCELDSPLVKTLTGGDPICVRGLYRDPIEFRPQFAVILVGNVMPRLPSDDPAIWERVRVIPFDVHIPAEERDPALRGELCDPAKHGAAILAWAVEGLRLLRSEGFNPPPAVLAASRGYQAQMDPVSRFVEERCERGADLEVPVALLYEAFHAWCRDEGHRELPRAQFARRLTALGCSQARTKTTRLWRGLALRPVED